MMGDIGTRMRCDYIMVRYITVCYKMVRYITVCYITGMLHCGTLHNGMLHNGMLHNGTLQNKCCYKTVHFTKGYGYKIVTVTKWYVLQNDNRY
jgi:hypothetical protein